MREPIKVLLADDQLLIRQGLRMILSVHDDIDVVGEASNGREAVELAARLRPDVVLMDVQMPVQDGIEATNEIAAQPDGPKVVILTTFDRDDYVFDALRAGASGFLLKNSGSDRLVEAVRVSAEGHALLSPEVTTRVLAAMIRAEPRLETRSPHRPAELTEREYDVLISLAKGYSNAEIAAELFVGEATVKTHVSNILMKLGLRDRVQAVAYAYRHDLAS